MAADDAHAGPDPAGTLDEEPHRLDPEWEDAFALSYGRRLWNVGCG